LKEGRVDDRKRSESNEWLFYLSTSTQDKERPSTRSSITPPSHPIPANAPSTPPKYAIIQPPSSRDYATKRNHKLSTPNKTIAPTPNPVKACNLLDPDLCTRISLFFPAFPFDFLLPTAVTFDTFVLLSNELEFETEEEVELLISVLLRLLFRSELLSFELSLFESELLLSSFESESENSNSSRTKSSSRQELQESESWNPPKRLSFRHVTSWKRELKQPLHSEEKSRSCGENEKRELEEERSMRFSSENWLRPLENSRIWRREALQDMVMMR
jgi:hypothetical protein